MRWWIASLALAPALAGCAAGDARKGRADEDSAGDGACPGDVWIRAAADVSAAAGCAGIAGSLIVSAPDLVDLTGLEGLGWIGGDLRIGSDEPLDLSGATAGSVVEVGPAQLASLRGLSGLRSIGGSLRVVDAPVLDDASCRRVYADRITVRAGARALTTLDGLDALTEVVGAVEGPSATAGCVPPDGDLPPLDASALDGVRVGGLALGVAELPAVLVAPGADVWVGPVTTSFGGVAWPEQLGRVVAQPSPALNPASLAAVREMGDVELYLPRGAGTGGFEGLTRAGSLRVTAAEAAGQFLSGFSALEVVDGDLRVDTALCLTGLRGLERLSRVGGDLTLYKTAVASLAPLSSLTHVGAFSAADNPVLDPAEIDALTARLGVPCGCAASVPECRCEDNGVATAMDGCP